MGVYRNYTRITRGLVFSDEMKKKQGLLSNKIQSID